MFMTKHARLLYFLFLIALLEITGWYLLSVFSKGGDFISNRHYDKIRGMLLENANEETISKYISVPYLSYIPNPGYENNGFTQHNTSGYRGEEIPLKRNSSYRILCLGGSTTYGTGVTDANDTYPAQLKTILEASGKFPQGVEVINAGVEAATSAEELNYYNFKFSYYQPDLVILHSGGNDALVFKDDSFYQLDYTNFRKLRFHFEPAPQLVKFLMHSKFFSFLLIHFIYNPMLYNSDDMFSNQGVESLRIAHWTDNAIIESQHFNPFYHNHKRLVENILMSGSKVLSMTFGFDTLFYQKHEMEKIQQGIEQNNQLIIQIADEMHIPLIPFQYASVTNTKYWVDDCHLTVEGEREKALLVSKYILKTEE